MTIRIKKVFDVTSMPSGEYSRSEGEWVETERIVIHPDDASKLVSMDDVRRDATAYAFSTVGKRDWWHGWTDVSDAGEEAIRWQGSGSRRFTPTAVGSLN